MVTCLPPSDCQQTQFGNDWWGQPAVTEELPQAKEGSVADHSMQASFPCSFQPSLTLLPVSMSLVDLFCGSLTCLWVFNFPRDLQQRGDSGSDTGKCMCHQCLLLRQRWDVRQAAQQPPCEHSSSLCHDEGCPKAERDIWLCSHCQPYSPHGDDAAGVGEQAQGKNKVMPTLR